MRTKKEQDNTDTLNLRGPLGQKDMHEGCVRQDPKDSQVRITRPMELLSDSNLKMSKGLVNINYLTLDRNIFKGNNFVFYEVMNEAMSNVKEFDSKIMKMIL